MAKKAPALTRLVKRRGFSLFKTGLMAHNGLKNGLWGPLSAKQGDSPALKKSTGVAAGIYTDNLKGGSPWEGRSRLGKWLNYYGLPKLLCSGGKIKRNIR